MTRLLPLMTEYRAGLEAEIAMLRRLAALAASERDATEAGQTDTLHDISDARDRVMASLVAIESQMKPIRLTLFEARERLRHLDQFAELSALHKEAAALASEIMANDEHSLAALQEAEHARRLAAESLEKGESTLAAYRRVVMPSLASATLVNRRG